jgi:hypothetical protein
MYASCEGVCGRAAIAMSGTWFTVYDLCRSEDKLRMVGSRKGKGKIKDLSSRTPEVAPFGYQANGGKYCGE